VPVARLAAAHASLADGSIGRAPARRAKAATRVAPARPKTKAKAKAKTKAKAKSKSKAARKRR
jgi:hypothetical protein